MEWRKIKRPNAKKLILASGKLELAYDQQN